MPEIAVNLSQKESELIEEYAERQGITPASAINTLYRENLEERLRLCRSHARKRRVVTPFRLPKKD